MLKKNAVLLYGKTARMSFFPGCPPQIYPHVTLCRTKKITGWRGYRELLEKYREKIIGEVKTEIVLYESDLCPDGAIYRKIEAVTKWRFKNY